MNYLLIGALTILLLAIVVGFRLGWELLQQNGRMLLRMEALEKRIEDKAERGKQKGESRKQKPIKPLPKRTERLCRGMRMRLRTGLAVAHWPIAKSNAMA